MTPLLVYFSSASLNTHRFVEKLGLRSLRIPLSNSEQRLRVSENYILISPTFAGANGSGAVPKQVIRFLNDEKNRSHLRGVIASGSRNFGRYFGFAGNVIAEKCGVPLLYKFELMGTPEEVDTVRRGVSKFWDEQEKVVPRGAIDCESGVY